jgi:hypothetical protein
VSVAPEEELEDDFIMLANGGELPALSKRTPLKPAGTVARQTSDDEDDGSFEELDGEEGSEEEDGMPALEPVVRRAKPKMPASTPHTKTVFDEHFEQVRAGQGERGERANRFSQVAKAYDDEQIGELDADDPRARGNLTLDSFNDILDEFLESRQMRTLLAPDQKVRPDFVGLSTFLTLFSGRPPQREAHNAKKNDCSLNWQGRCCCL